MRDKQKNWQTHLAGASLAWLLSACAVGSLVTGLNLHTGPLWQLFLWCEVFAVASVGLLSFRYGALALSGLWLLAAPFLWQKGALWRQLLHMLLPLNIFSSTAMEMQPVVVTLPLLVMAMWTACAVSWCVCRRRHLLFAIPPVALPLVLCLLVADNVPDESYLYLTLLGLTLLLLTDWVRWKKPAQFPKLLLRTALPVAVAIAVLFAANPQEKYVNHAWKIQEKIESWIQLIEEKTGRDETPGEEITSPVVSQRLNLKFIGPKSQRTRPIMRVNVSVDRQIYLREIDYDMYFGTSWGASLNREEMFAGGAYDSEIQISTYGVRTVRYVPYYFAGAVQLINGALPNGENLQTYSYALSPTPAETATPDAHYTDLPEETRQWAEALIADILSGAQTVSEKAAAIENYVENAAAYDLNTLRMDSQHTDFAQWFLEESDTGYCVHFATAATVLLRAAGIPARYVEGYMVTCQAGVGTDVLMRDGHAWSEYYDEDLRAWCLLEATPADGAAGEVPPESSEPETTETEPEPSETESGAQTETTRPEPETTAPSTPPADTPHTENNAPFPPNWLRATFWSLAAVACVPLQSHIRIARKRKKWERGAANEKTITRWWQVKTMARRLGVPFSEELEQLALKAKFSQHTITPEELEQFDAYRETLLRALRSKRLYQRLLLRWFFAIG